MRTSFVAWCLSLLVLACVPPAQRPADAPEPSARGGYIFELDELSIRTTAPMVAEPLTQSLTILLQQIDDSYAIENSDHDITGFSVFIKKSLQSTLSPYFKRIEFVDKDDDLPDEPYFVAQFKADPIRVNSIYRGAMPHDVLEMGWAFAIRPSSQKEFLFSCSGLAKSEMAYETLYVGVQQVMRSAMDGLLKTWDSNGVYARLKNPDSGKKSIEAQVKACVLALFDIQDASKSLKPETLPQLSLYLGTLLVQQGKFHVLPRKQLRAQLLDEKTGGYRQCVDESCQIELGKALAAEKTLSTSMIRIDKQCVFTASLYDLKTETAQRGASVMGGCEEKDLLEAMQALASQL